MAQVIQSNQELAWKLVLNFQFLQLKVHLKNFLQYLRLEKKMVDEIGYGKR
jgi:hypothetical protein